MSHGGSDVQVILPKEIIGSRYSATNPTCVVFGENLVFNSRLVNYRKVLQNDEMSFTGVNRNQTCLLHNYGFNSRNVMFGLYGENISWASETNYPVGDQSLFYKGLEDCRLVVWDGVLYAYGTRWDVGAGDTARICLYQLDGNLQPIKETVVESPFGLKIEKNWAAVEGKPFTFIYQYDPVVIVRITDLNTGACETVRNDDLETPYDSWFPTRGSSQVVRISDNMYISIVHTADTSESECGMLDMRYRSAFVLMDNDFNIIKTSDWFVFRTDMSEFCCGIAVFGGFVWIPYSQCDCTVNILKIPLDGLLRFVDGDNENSELYGFDYIFRLASQYELAEQFMSSSVLYNYAALLSEPLTYWRTICLSKTFDGLVNEFEDLVDPSFVTRVKSLLQKAIVDNRCMWQLYDVLARISRFEENMVEYEKYMKIAGKQCASFDLR
jgi:hypothetical protein